jgi:hypothetical protein
MMIRSLPAKGEQHAIPMLTEVDPNLWQCKPRLVPVHCVCNPTSWIVGRNENREQRAQAEVTLQTLGHSPVGT